VVGVVMVVVMVMVAMVVVMVAMVVVIMMVVMLVVVMLVVVSPPMCDTVVDDFAETLSPRLHLISSNPSSR
jgi:hypothetical protein